MKRTYWSILLLSMLLVSAKPIKTVRLMIVNKSGLPVEVSLTGQYLEQSYYLRVPKGDRLNPAEYHADVVPDIYSLQIYYKELWDPVYGYDCTQGGKTAEVLHSTRLTFLGCNYNTPNNGEPPSILKYPQGAGGRGRGHAPR